MRILLFVDKLFGGGAERVASILLNHLCEKHNVTAIIFNDKLPTYPIKPEIKIKKITIDNRIRILHPIERIHKIRQIIKRNNPDMIISFMVELNIYVLLANIFNQRKIIVSERSTIQKDLSIIFKLTQHFLYKLASNVVFVSKNDYNYAKWLKNKTFIYNPLSCHIINEQPQRENTIVAIGAQRRWHVKGFDTLILAWARIAQSHPDWKLQFIGLNNDIYISSLTQSYYLERQVEFLGWENNINEILRTKSIYILSSRSEGFPNSLIEAMSQGCACVAFDCKTGPNEIITDGKSGLLARNGDVDDLAAKLQLLIEDENLRQKLSAGAIEEVKRFDYDSIMNQWDELIRLTIEN